MNKKELATEQSIEVRPGGYKEMSSIFADQKRPRNTSPNAGRGGAVAGSQPMSTAVHVT
jgi:hypothetical protein